MVSIIESLKNSEKMIQQDIRSGIIKGMWVKWAKFPIYHSRCRHFLLPANIFLGGLKSGAVVGSKAGATPVISTVDNCLLTTFEIRYTIEL